MPVRPLRLALLPFLAVGLFAWLQTAGCGSKCTSQPLANFKQCTPDADAGSIDCQATEACINVLGNQSDTRCFPKCKGGICDPGLECSPTGVGQGCGKLDQDAGGGCVTVFACYPNLCN